MSVNKKNRSLWGSRSEAQRIYYQRQTIKRLEKENNQLKQQRQELRSWLEDEKDRLARECSQIYEDSLGKTRLVNKDIFNEVNKILSKLNELEGVNNDK